MNQQKNSIINLFYEKLLDEMEFVLEMSLQQIYSVFPDTKQKTISWRLYSLVKEGKLYRSGHGYYSIIKESANKPAGYDYLQKKSKKVYDELVEFGYKFYVSGLDSLVGEVLHIPESYPAIVVIEANGLDEARDALAEKNMIVATEKDWKQIRTTAIKDKVDVILFKGKDFELSEENIALKEKGFVDLYYAITRMDYGLSVPELSRIYNSIQRKKSATEKMLKRAAKDRRIMIEINWLIEMSRATERTLEFMSYQMKVGE
jgi:hypothetical protein